MTENYSEANYGIQKVEESNSQTGTTANAYAEAKRIDAKTLKEKMMVLTNTHATNVLKYKLEGYAAKYGVGQAFELVPETTLAGASEQALFTFQRLYACLVLSVKSSVTDTHATYQIDYIGATI